MKIIRIALLALVFAASSIATPATAASYSADQSDLWWTNPPGSENGWGIQFVQRGNTIFATMFVYGPSGVPIWYVATMVAPSGGTFIWSGDLYTTGGPWFGAMPYNPALFFVRKVGTMTFNSTSVITGILTYDVDGVPVTKNLTRQTLVVENYSGHFGGGIHEVDTACSNPAFNGTTENIGILNIGQSGSIVAMTVFPATGGSCDYSGVLTQYGQMGDLVGNYACTNGSFGSFHIFELQITEISVNGRFVASATVPAGCQASGWFGGLRVTTF